MICRCLVAIALLALGFMPGCGLALRKMEGESLAAVGTVTRTFPESSHRVALAAFEAMRGELASADVAKDSEFFSSPNLVKPDGTKPKEGELPPNYPAFWVEWKNPKEPGKTIRDLMTLGACHLAGKTRDGRSVEVAILFEPKTTLVTVHVDRMGDRAVSQALLDKVADRLAHPANPPGSLEEAETFKAFFGGVESREALPSIRKKPDVSR